MPFGEVYRRQVQRRDITHDYEHGFQGMTATNLPIDALCDAHARLVEDCVTNMPEEHKVFLYVFSRVFPNGICSKSRVAKNCRP